MNIRILRIPIIVIVVNFIVFSLIPADLTGLVGVVIYNLLRFSMIAFAGWLVVKKGNGKIRTTAYVGFFLFAFDHIVLKGGKFLIIDTFIYNDSLQSGVDAFIGVLISFGMWCALPVAVAVVGGLVAKRT